MSSASRSRMAFWYSVRFSRRKVAVRPGSGRRAAARSSSASSAATNDSYARSSGRFRPAAASARRQLPHHLFPDLRVGGHVLGADGVEVQPPGFLVAVVAARAVLGDELLDGGAPETFPGRRGGLGWLLNPRHADE